MDNDDFLRKLLAEGQLNGGQVGSPLPAGFSQAASGLAVAPGGQLTMLTFGGIYMVFSDYAPLGDLGKTPHKVAADLQESFAAGEPFLAMMAALAALNHFAHYPDQAGPAIETLRSALQPEPRQRFENRLADRQVFARQPVLRAMRLVLSNPDRQFVRQHPVGVDPIFLVHATGDAMTRDDPHSQTEIGGLPDDAVLDLIANWTFHEGDDRWALMTRQTMLWRAHGEEAKKQFGDKSAVDLLTEATDLEPEDFLAFGFALISHMMAWTPGQPSLFNLANLKKASPVLRDRFIELVSGTPEDFKQAFAATNKSQWDLLAFESKPVLRFDRGLLVLDESLLWERITSGLYWFVFDYLKRAKGYPEAERWTRAWGDIVEATVGDMLQSFALIALGGTPLIWTEDDVQTAYGKDKPAADFVLDRGDRLVMFEVVSGQLTTNTRINLTRSGFDGDLEKLVISKVIQLDGTARSLLADEALLTGVSSSTTRHVIPVVVAAMSFPYVEPVVKHIRRLLSEMGLLQDSRIEPLCIIDLRELEVLEGAAEAGNDPASLLLTWQAQTRDHPVSFWNWVMVHQSLVGSRPKRMRTQGENIFTDIKDRLGLEGDLSSPWDEEEAS